MRDRQRQRHRQREKQAPHREPEEGLKPRTLGSHPEPKTDTQSLSHPDAQAVVILNEVVRNGLPKEVIIEKR